MSALTWWNGAAAALCFAVSAALALPLSRADRSPGALASGQTGVTPTFADLEAAAARDRGLRDAQGHFVPLREYRHIVALSGLADELLRELCEPDRIASFSYYSATRSSFSYRYRGRPQLAQPWDLEALIALQPDLVLLNSLRRPDRVERLREAGIEVFDLGEMRGRKTLVPNIAAVSALLGHPERGRELARSFERRLQALAAQIPDERRPWALYVSAEGSALYGGSTGTSFHDVLRAAGLRDVAAQRYEGWPRYTAEQLLQLDPEVIVTHTGMGGVLCRQPGLAALRACNGGGRIAEVPAELITDPGLHMLEAAEAVYAAVHPDAPEPAE